MAWYYGTYSCGHEGRTGVIGPVKNRQWIADRHFENICEDCYKLKLREENAKALEQSKEMELTELVGTEKQIAWANSLRLDLIDGMEKLITKVVESRQDIYREVIDYVINNKTKASWFIDNRNSDIKYLSLDLYKEYTSYKEQKEVEPLVEEIKAETTVYPENKITDAVVEIVIEGETIKARFEKNDEFINIVKLLGYKWDGVWKRTLVKTNGTVKDRAAELGNKLLNAGFPIQISDINILDKAVVADYEPECKRWIFRSAQHNKLSIQWEGRDDDLYKSAKSLPSAKWRDGRMLVNQAHHLEVKEFAEMFGFKFTEKADELIWEQIQLQEKALKVKPASKKAEDDKNGLKDILNSGDDILDDLKDNA